MNRYPNIERRDSGPAHLDRTSDEYFERTTYAALIPERNVRSVAIYRQEMAARQYAHAAELRDMGLTAGALLLQGGAARSSACVRALMIGGAA